MPGNVTMPLQVCLIPQLCLSVCPSYLCVKNIPLCIQKPSTAQLVLPSRYVLYCRTTASMAVTAYCCFPNVVLQVPHAGRPGLAQQQRGYLGEQALE